MRTLSFLCAPSISKHLRDATVASSHFRTIASAFVVVRTKLCLPRIVLQFVAAQPIMNVLVAAAICHLDMGKKNKCNAPVDDDGTIQPCVGAKCKTFIHLSCCKLMMDHHSVPAGERPTTETERFIAFCRKHASTIGRQRKRERPKPKQETRKKPQQSRRKGVRRPHGTKMALFEHCLIG